MSRIHESLFDISTTETASGSIARAFSHWSAFTPTVTGSKRAIAVATSTQPRWAGFAPSRQLSVRCGHNIHVRVWGSHSAGMRYPSALGVLSIVVMSPPFHARPRGYFASRAPLFLAWKYSQNPTAIDRIVPPMVIV